MPFEAIDYLTTVASIVLRGGSYLTLRWLPSRFSPLAVPIVFILFFAGWFALDGRLIVIESQTQRLMASNAASHTNGKSEPNQKLKAIGDGVTRDDVVAATAVRDDTLGSNGSSTTPAASYAAVVKSGGIKEEEKTLSTFDPSPANPRTSTSPGLLAPWITVPPRPSWFSFLTGAPTSSRVANRISLLINLLLLVFAIDMLWVPYFFVEHKDLAFSRVGAVGPTWAKISARVPPHERPQQGKKGFDPLDSVRGGREGARVLYRMTKPRGQWLIGPEVKTDNGTDWMGTVTVDYLLPSTEYEYQLTLPLEPTKQHPFFPKLGQFKTAPDPRTASAGQTHYTFASTSCIKPGFPYKPFQSHTAIPGARHLAKTIKDEAVDFVLFLGDFIYSDVPRYPNSQVDSYNKRYRQVFASKDWQKVTELAPTMHVYDDHEIYNDWSGRGNDSSPIFSSANKAYSHYLGDANPAPVSLSPLARLSSLSSPPPNYYAYTYGDSAFFFWDTRRYRSYNHDLDDESKTMLGEEQKKAFVSWLGEVNQTVTFKFVVSSAPFMTLWKSAKGGPANDTWAGFTKERSELMDVMEYVPNIIVLSGDRHEFAAASIRNTVVEVSTSPLSFFYIPFVRTLQQENGLGKTGEETLLKYLPNGISKFSTFEVDGRILNKPKVTLKVWIDGKEAWRLQILGKPVHRVGTAVGALRKSLKDLFRKLVA